MKRKKLTSKQQLKKAKKKLKSLGRRNKTFIKLICQGCKREFKIRTNDKSIYTEEVKANWYCLICNLKRRK